MSLYLDVSVGDVLHVGQTQVEVVHKSGRRVRFRITGPDNVDLVREPRQDTAPRSEPEPAHGRRP